MFRTLSVLVAASVLCGCTTTLSSKIFGQGDSKSEKTTSGLTYKLPTKRLTLSAAFQITDCVSPDQITANVTPTLTQSIEGDDSAVYILDYEQLKAPTKVQKLSVSLNANGLITAINSDNQDKTADVISNTVSSVLTVARAVALSGIAPGPRPAPHAALPFQSNGTIPDLCKNYLAERVKKWKGLPAQIDAAKQADTKRSKAAADLASKNADLKVLQADATYYAQIGNKAALARAEADEAALRTDIKKLTAIIAALGDPATADLQSQLANLQTQLTFTVTKSIVPEKDAAGKVAPIDIRLDESDDIKYSLFKDKSVTCPACPTVSLTIDGFDPKPRPAAVQAAPSQGAAGPPGYGLVYRVAKMAKVDIKVSQGGRDYLSQHLDVPMPQFGGSAYLNLNNYPFEDNVLAVSFDENGGISKLDFSSTAQAQAATAALNSTAQSYLSFVQNVQSDRVTATKQNLDLQKTQADTAAAVAADKNAITKGAADTASAVATDKVSTLQNLLDLQALQAGQGNPTAKAIVDLTRANQLIDLQIQNAQKLQQLRALQNGTGAQ